MAIFDLKMVVNRSKMVESKNKKKGFEILSQAIIPQNFVAFRQAVHELQLVTDAAAAAADDDDNDGRKVTTY